MKPFESFLAHGRTVTKQTANAGHLGGAFNQSEGQRSFFQIFEACESAFELLLCGGIGQFA